VQKIKQLSSLSYTTALERMLGAEATVDQQESVNINKFIICDHLVVSFNGESIPEEQARLFLFPVEDHQYHLQLLYFEPISSGVSLKLTWLRFLPGFFEQYPEDLLASHTPFRFDQTTEQQFNICSQTKSLLEQLSGPIGFTPLIKAMQTSEMAIQLLRRAIESVTLPFAVCQVPACRFLAYESEREKIIEARKIVEQSIEQPFTIKELSRKVAMNECYLKKGFKALTGKTINEYQQELRINSARELLKQQGQTVSEVALLLGYSSISHFSTAFKKATGIKPCELLG
jgi:AraC-like DNA-binding protein